MSDTKHMPDLPPQFFCGCDEVAYCSVHAAAPDLLAALEAAPTWIDDGTVDPAYIEWYEGPRAAALAKAKP